MKCNKAPMSFQYMCPLKKEPNPNCCHVVQKDTDIRVNGPLTSILLARATADLCHSLFPNVPGVRSCAQRDDE